MVHVVNLIRFKNGVYIFIEVSIWIIRNHDSKDHLHDFFFWRTRYKRHNREGQIQFALGSTHYHSTLAMLWKPHCMTRVSILTFTLLTCFSCALPFMVVCFSVPLLADIFLYSYETFDIVFALGQRETASRFNSTYRYIDVVLSIHYPDFENYLSQMYLTGLEIKNTAESNTFASFLDFVLSFRRDGLLHTSISDKRDDFNFHIKTFPFLSSHFSSSPVYEVLSHCSYDMLGIVPFINVLFWR